MLEFHRPTFDELSFREKMLADGETMSYNRAYGGTIAFPREKWAAWYEKWISDPQGKRFYRYVKENGRFVGEVAYHLDESRKLYLADVLIYAPYRGRGYGRAALRLLCDVAGERGVCVLCDEIAAENPSLELFFSCGFFEVSRTEGTVLVKKQLTDAHGGEHE